MKSFLCLLVAGVVLVSSATAEKDSFISLIEDRLIASSFLSGQNQVLAADISPKCKDIAMTNLAAAQEKAAQEKVCASTITLVGEVLDVAFNSTADLITDLNTVINGIPSCIDDHAWYNFLGIMGCVIGQVKPLWTASVHFVHFKNYYMDTYNKVAELMKCLEGSKTEADKTVKKLVSMAKICQIHQ